MAVKSTDFLNAEMKILTAPIEPVSFKISTDGLVFSFIVKASVLSS